MAIEKSLAGLLNQDDFDTSPEGLVVVEEEGEIPEDSLMTEMDDGSVVIDFDPLSELMGGGEEFDSNLTESMEENELRTRVVGATGSRPTKRGWTSLVWR
jgi:hypothetical protein